MLPPFPLPAAHAWRHLRRSILTGPPNRRLGLVQGQQLLDMAGAAHLVRGGLARVRIPAHLIGRDDDAWQRHRFLDAARMQRLRSLGVPFKAVIELPVIEIGPHFLFSDEQHAAHATRLAAYRPDVVIIGNEVNVVDGQPGLDLDAVIERYLDRYALIHQAIRAAAPETRIQLYGEAYFGQPHDPNVLMRRLLSRMRQRGVPPPDIAGIHVYDHAGHVPARVRGYRDLLKDFGLRIPISIEEIGPRMGVIDQNDAGTFARIPSNDGARFPHWLAELRANGWISEDEHAELVAQQLTTSAAVADQAQVFCAADFRAELQWRRGLVSFECGRPRPALDAFYFTQRLLNDAEVQLAPSREDAGVVHVSVRRRDGIAAHVYWLAPRATDAGASGGSRSIVVPPHTFVCDARGRLIHEPQPRSRTISLPDPTSAESGGAVRVLV